MAKLRLILGNKNYSSWSLRAWLAASFSGEPFDEHVIPLGTPETREQILRHSPSGRVPALVDGELVIWDSLAIFEYLAERHPSLWPADRAARARARSVTAEMHSGFQALRANMPMNVRRSSPGVGRAPGVAEDIARVVEIWRECLQRSGGPFLFGARTLADAAYAPVVSRFRTYAVEVDAGARAYLDTISNLPEMKSWAAAAAAEPWIEADYDR
jgi:glutathione S-transferase